jgi:RNA polymerase sigma-70 factor (ECF subfamily)
MGPGDLQSESCSFCRILATGLDILAESPHARAILGPRAMAAEFPHLSALRAGDVVAWNAAFSHLWPVAVRAAYHPEACLVPWEREEVASEAILELIEHFDTVKSAEEAKALLATIAYRRAISFARKKFAAKRTRPEEDDLKAAAEAASNPNQLCEIERAELICLLGRALNVLEPETRQLLMEKIEQASTYQEISVRHGLPLGTVCTKVARGLKKVCEQLQGNPWLMKELRGYLR